MISMPDNLPDDPELLKQMLLETFELLGRQQEIDQAHQSQSVDLEEQIKFLCDRLFGREFEQTADPQTPQLALFNEPESVELTVPEDDEEVVAPSPRRGKRKPLSADLPRIEIVHELPEHDSGHSGAINTARVSLMNSSFLSMVSSAPSAEPQASIQLDSSMTASMANWFSSVR
jgi:hypothetical protein